MIHGTMTVGELRRKLLDFKHDMPVLTEGCDCSGSAFQLEVRTTYDFPSGANEPSGMSVLFIERNPETNT